MTSFWKQVGVLAGSTVTAQVVTLLAMPAITRLFSPEEYGVFVVLMAFLAMWSTLLTLRYESAIFVAESAADVKSLIALCQLAIVGVSLLALPVLMTLRALEFAQLATVSAFAAMIGLGFLPGAGFYQVFRALGIRNGSLRAVQTATVGRSVASALGKILLGALGLGASGLVLAETIAVWSGVWLLYERQSLRFARRIERGGIAAIARRYPKYPKYELPSTLIDSLGALLVLPLLAQVFGLKEAALFGLAQRVVALPNTHIGAAVADVAQRELAERVRAGESAAIKHQLGVLLKRLALLGLIPLIATVLLAPPLFGFVFGQAWQQSGLVAAIIAPWLYAAFVVGSVSRVLLVIQKQEYKLAYDVLSSLWVVTVFIVAARLDLEFLHAIALLTLGRVCGYVLYLMILIFATRPAVSGEAAP